MFTTLLNKVMDFFTVSFSVLRFLFEWIFNHFWAFILAIFTPVVAVWRALIERLNNWMFAKLSLEGMGEYDWSTAFDYIDHLISSFLPKNLLGMIGADAIYVLNLSAFAESVVKYLMPILFSAILYKLVKSFIPTISGT